jgi:hypothetical protein
VNRIAVVLLVALISFDLHASTPNPYPNEIGNLKFYVRHLTPLRPGHSDSKDVIQLFGSNQELQLNGWKIGVLYSCDDDPIVCSHGPRNDHLYQIVVTPKHRVSLRHSRFSSVFSHSFGTISEINVTCDVYKDSFGLEYWVVSRNYPSYKEGDLLQVLYGTPHPIVPQVTIQSSSP